MGTSLTGNKCLNCETCTNCHKRTHKIKKRKINRENPDSTVLKKRRRTQNTKKKQHILGDSRSEPNQTNLTKARSQTVPNLKALKNMRHNASAASVFAFANTPNEERNNELYVYHAPSNSLQLNMGKLIPPTVEKNRNLLRENTPTQWDDSDMSDLENDIQSQIYQLSAPTADYASDKRTRFPIQLSASHSVPLPSREETGLFRATSPNKWSAHNIDTQMESMEKEMKYLIQNEMKANEGNIANDTIVETESDQQ